ncbi:MULTISPECIES: hypothetical protein [unclassified Shewanella]|uniref:hypothetical protein n=1 Tax=unclassified Shewanella TaxID=196818 RepID=UPI001BBBE090|nr:MULTISPECIES: hypothetical protein [unclassified Shewanella]GIU17634.1 hypothetical protein TUM4444_31750 [Shewanella sp. MBTL60-112-B1]GIU36690.1 hypothetical protein TUM4445_28130 [Shewanella sp. MBTL60-112-B2]
MKGWIILAIIAGTLYYLYTETDTLDEPIAEVQGIYQQAEDKLDSMTGTQIQRIDDRVDLLKTDIADRLSTTEQQALKLITQSQAKLDDFKDEFCGSGANSHSAFSKENQTYICDKLN